MRTDHRWLVAFAGNVVFLWVVAQVNHYLSSVNLGFTRGPLYLSLLGLPVAFAALRLNLRHALLAIVPTALAFEADLPIPSGLLMLTAAACACAAIALRANFNRFESRSALLASLVINLVLFTALTIAVPPVTGVASGARLASDLLFSQLALVALAGWFWAFQIRLLQIFGFNLTTELREPL